MSVDDAKLLHRKAMDLSDDALTAKLHGKPDHAATLLRQAFEMEAQAAAQCANDMTLEPTRSVLHRSAATFALECREFREAERLIAVALSGNPPEEIADELRDLLEQVHFERHLNIKGITLEPDEVQLSLAGKTVGHGVVPMEEFVGRIQAFERLVHRTAERKLGLPYRETGSPSKELRDNYEVFVSAPLAGSFVVTIRIGRPTSVQQGFLFETAKPPEVMDEILECLEKLNEGDRDAVHVKITDEAYFRNFIGLAKKLAPDGSEVRSVNLSLMKQDKRKDLTLYRTARSILPPIRKAPATEEAISVSGELRYADSTSEASGKIKLIEKNGTEHSIIVPQGMMSDIVRPLWEKAVIVDGVRSNAIIYLEDIREDDKQ